MALLAALQAEAGAAARTAATASAMTPPAPDAAAGADCIRALRQRAVAAGLVQSAVTALLGGATGTASTGTAASRMQSAGQMVQASDAAWARCRSSLRAAPGRASLPASSWGNGGSGVTTAALTSAASTLVSAPSLAAAPGLSVAAVTTDPAAVGVSSGTPAVYTLPATGRLAVRVLVADTGNVSLPAVTVAVTVAPDSGGAGASAHRTVSLAAGSAQAVDLAGLAVVPGSSDTVTVTAGAGGAAPSLPATSVALSIAQAASTVAVTPSANPVSVGATVTYTAAVSGSLPGAGALTGTVAFEDGGNPIPGCTSQPLSGGSATCAVHYTTGGYHTVTAVYGGTATIGGSTSPAITETVHARSRSSRRTTGSSGSAAHPSSSSRRTTRSGG